MYLIEMKRNGQKIYDGAIAMAVQVYAQKNIFLGEDIVFPYISKPLVQVGRYQNTREEVNLPYVKENNINIVRRDTGGGTLYLDENCVNFCFLKEVVESNKDVNFADLYQPLIDILRELGAQNVELSGRNDLQIEGKKISGAAMSIVNGRQYGGYSLLLDIDHEKMTNAIKPNQKKMQSKGIKSVRSRVHSLRHFLSDEYKDLTSDELSELLVLKMFKADSMDDVKKYELTDEDWANIDQMMQDKYDNWEWTFGKSPSYTFSKDGRFKIGTIDIKLKVVSERIEDATIYGDFFGNKDISKVEAVLKGVRLEETDLIKALESIDLKDYLGDITASEISQLILG